MITEEAEVTQWFSDREAIDFSENNDGKGREKVQDTKGSGIAMTYIALPIHATRKWQPSVYTATWTRRNKEIDQMPD